jgi:hypothetical protein
MGKSKSNKSTSINLNTKERALLRACAKHKTTEDIEQSTLFAVFERKGKRTHEKAGWDVRNSVRRPIAMGFLKRAGRGLLRVTSKGIAAAK